MAKGKPITVRSWVHKGGELVNVDTLSPAEREKVATQLKLAWLNALYKGVATFERETPQPKKEAHNEQQINHRMGK